MRWSADFVHDRFARGRRFRIFNVIDDVTKVCLAAVVDTSVSGRRVARELTALIARHGKPGLIVSDHGAEFTSNAMLAWSEQTGVPWHFIAPGKPMQNAICEAFNSKMRSGRVRQCQHPAERLAKVVVYPSASGGFWRDARTGVVQDSSRRHKRRRAAALAHCHISAEECDRLADPRLAQPSHRNIVWALGRTA